MLLWWLGLVERKACWLGGEPAAVTVADGAKTGPDDDRVCHCPSLGPTLRLLVSLRPSLVASGCRLQMRCKAWGARSLACKYGARPVGATIDICQWQFRPIPSTIDSSPAFHTRIGSEKSAQWKAKSQLDSPPRPDPASLLWVT